MEEKLDLQEFLDKFRSFLSRPKDLAIEGDSNLHYKFIQELFSYTFKAPVKVKNLDRELRHLQKQGILHLDEIFEFIKIIRYFLYLKGLKFEGNLKEWLDTIVIPDEILQIEKFFDEKGQLLSSVDERLEDLQKALQNNKTHIKQKLQSLINANKLQSYLVDRQIHYVAGEEALLVRGGFNHVLKATVVGRSSGGFFYVVPEALKKLKEKEAEILSQIEEIHYQIQKYISATFTKWLKFLVFLNKAFDRFDHYQARVFFAKQEGLFIILPRNDRKIMLKEFRHPAIENPKPISIDFSKKVLIITGVNAGGKTMLLKSLLSAVYLAKYLIPMPCDPKSHIGRFKEIIPIIEDP